MKIIQKRNYKKIIISVTIILVLAGCAAIYLYLSTNGDERTNKPDLNSNPTVEQREGEKTVDQPLKSETLNKTDTKAQLDDIQISSTNQDGSILSIRTILRPLISDGKCTLKMTKKGEQNLELDSTVQSMSSYSVCRGFDVNVSSLTRGEWNIEVTHSNNSAIAAKETVNIK